MITIKTFTFNPIQENTYLLFNDTLDCAIIDPGCYFGNERKELSDFITENALQVRLLLNTHCHLDHVFGNKYVVETYQTLPHIHRKEQPVLNYAGVSGKGWGLPFDNYTGAVQYISEGEIIMLGNDALKTLFVPGHSPGHVAFYSESQEFVIGGDVLFRMSIGRTDLPGADHDTLLQSIRTQFFTLADDVTVYPGHGETTTIGFEKKHNPFLAG